MPLPKLKKVKQINVMNRQRKRKILLLADDIRFHSGIATMSREIVKGTAHRFSWVQLGAGQKHPQHGQVLDYSKEINEMAGIDHAEVKIYAHNGYGNPDVLRHLITTEKPEAIVHFTDPRFWDWLYLMEHEIKTYYGVPIMYYNIWDDAPVPHWNEPFYKSCDLIMNISRQTHNLVKLCLGDEACDIDEGEDKDGVKIAYVPHGINEQQFYKIEDSDDEILTNLKKQWNLGEYNFIVFWNNRNIRRKQPGDVILAYRRFCDRLPKEESEKCLLLMHTHPQDPNGTDILAVKQAVCPDYDVIIDGAMDRSTEEMNALYNLADVTLNIASNEGFGISGVESLMTETPIINNVTGGLQDHLRFEDKDGNWIKFDKEFTSNHTGKYRNCGVWGYPVFPSNRSLQGSLPTPYIFDDRCSFEDVADGLMWWYQMDKEKREYYGGLGRAWVTSEESGMSATQMCEKMEKHIEDFMGQWRKPKSYTMFTVNDEEPEPALGIYFDNNRNV